jgi:hypothetical protein
LTHQESRVRLHEGAQLSEAARVGCTVRNTSNMVVDTAGDSRHPSRKSSSQWANPSNAMFSGLKSRQPVRMAKK